jgi:hypothetical protein
VVVQVSFITCARGRSLSTMNVSLFFFIDERTSRREKRSALTAKIETIPFSSRFHGLSPYAIRT